MEQSVPCPLPGLQMVTVVYNMMASVTAFDEFKRTLGNERRDEVIASIDGWPDDSVGGPFGENAPMGFRLWLIGAGMTQAMLDFARNPR